MVLILKWGWSPSLHNLISSTPNNTKPLRISTWSQGLNMLCIIYEPTATTISYSLDKKDGWLMRRMCWLSILVVVVVPSMCRPFWPSRRKASSLRSEGLYCWWPSLGRRGWRQSPRGPSLLLQEFERNSSSRTYLFFQRRATKLSIYLTYSDEVGMMRKDLTCSSTAYSSTVYSQIWKVLNH